MVRLKLRRQGKKKQPTYRLVAADSQSPRDGRFIEILGHYNPRTEPPTLVLNEEKIRGWLKQGAKPTDSVRQLLSKVGIVSRTEGAAKDSGSSVPSGAKAEVSVG